MKSSRCKAPTQSTTCSGRLAPISAEVTRPLRSTQAMAICASVWPRAFAISFNALIEATFSSLMKAGRSDLPWAARLFLRNAVEVLRRQHAMRERGKDDRTDAQPVQRIEQPVILHPAVEDRIARLVDQHRRAEIAQDGLGLARALGIVGRDAA